MMKRSVALLLAFMMLFGLVQVAMAYDDDVVTTMYVDAGKARIKLFSETSTKSKVLTRVPNGAKVTCYNLWYGSKWANVSYDGYYGYVLQANLSDRKPKPKPTPKPTPRPTHKPTPHPTAKPTAKPISYEDFTQVDYYAQITLSTPDGRLNMRWQPSSDANIIGVYANGTVLQVLMESKSWLQVMDLDTNRVGFMSRKYLKEVAEPIFGVENDLVYDAELVVSPMNSVDSFEALQAALPEIELFDVPEGATNVSYDWINTEPTIAQIIFDFDGVTYCYRAAHSETAEDMVDIDGIYTPLHEEESGHEEIELLTDEEHKLGIVHYFYAERQTQMSLACEIENADAGATLIKLLETYYLDA